MAFIKKSQHQSIGKIILVLVIINKIPFDYYISRKYLYVYTRMYI